MLARRAVVFAAFLAGCNGSGGPAAPEEVVLQVSASHGLGSMVPGPSTGGAAAYAMDLVYEPLRDHARVTGREGAVVFFERLPETTHPASELAGALRFKGLAEARAVGEDRVRARFDTEQAAEEFAGWRHLAFAFGPFEIDEQSDEMIRLRARNENHALDAIEIVAVEEEQQWRRLLARDVDVVPVTDATRVRRLEDVGSIRVLPIRSRRDYALIFNVQEPKLRTAGVRRALTRLIDTGAMARIACGTPSCSAGARDLPLADKEEPSTMPEELRALVLGTDDVAASAAEVLRHQLRRRGVALTIEKEPPGEASARVSRGDFELAFLPLVAEPSERLLRRLASFGYESEELEVAVGRGDEGAAREILGREVPMLPLFEARYHAAVDSEFCGGDPESITSWRWLADLYPCESSE